MEYRKRDNDITQMSNKMPFYKNFMAKILSEKILIQYLFKIHNGHDTIPTQWDIPHWGSRQQQLLK